MFNFGLTDLQAKKAPPPPSIAMDEDAQKRNTDCIYFLASPLTCKKGNNCEYRHSEAARTNPRDCWYWKSGNCLNAHCSFRHLPLEGKPGSASVSSTSTAPTMPQFVSATSMAVAAGPSKSKTPCYFFSQGYCAKNDKCTFMHGSPVASAPAEAPAEKNSASGVSGKNASGRPLIVLKQSGLISHEVRPVTNRPEALNEAHPVSSLASVSVPQVLNGLERAIYPERVADFVPFRCDKESKKSGVQAIPDLSNRSRQSKVSKKTSQDQDNCQRFAQAGENQNGFQSKALWKDGSSGGSSHQSPGSEEGEYSSLSDSRKSPKGLSNSPASDGQDSDDTYGECKDRGVESKGDLRNHLTKRMKINSSLHSSIGKGGHPGLATQRRGGGKLSDDHPKQKKQQQGGNNRNLVVEAHLNVVKRAQFNKGGSSDVPNEAPKQIFKKLQSRSFTPVVDHSKVHNFEAVPISEKRVHPSSKSSTSENVKETLTFAGPKSLAQIKAEKMAVGQSASKAIERLDSNTAISESGSKLADRKLAVRAESWDAAASNDEPLRPCMGVVSTIQEDDVFKHETENSEEFEGQTSVLSKRKRELESGSNVKETMPGPSEVQDSMLKSFREMEDGEFCEDEDNSNVDDLRDICNVVSSQEDFVVTSPSNAKEEVSQGLERLSGEAAEFETESSEDGAKFDLEMEENAYGGEDYEIDDDDEDDFAKKLGRFFGLSND